jgi:replication factor C subunit 2/4
MIRFSNLFDDNEIVDNINYVENKKSKYKVPWVDKYRPKTLDDIVQQDEIINFLKKSLINSNMPHLLFYGPPGSGKTSAILAIANQLYGPIKFSERVIELNASDDSGINAVRHKIITFAEMKIGNPDKNYPCPPYKIVILDEADAMTTEAQSALRKVMEDLSSITRFCFICNYIEQISEPISSRCMKFRFKPVNNISINERLHFIAGKEKMDVSYDIIDAISNISKGDLRRSIMTLQNLSYIYKYKDIITIEDVYDITNMLPENELINIWNICNSTDPDVINIIELTNKLIEYSYPIDNILYQLKNKIIDSDITDVQKSIICIQLHITEKRLIEGSNEYIQLLNILCFIKGVISNIILDVSFIH